MIRNSVVILLAVVAGFSCVRFEKRAARYDTTACPICSHVTDGICSYCNGSKECMYCKGQKERLTVSPNIIEDSGIKPFSYKTPCPFCKSTGVCTYCNGTGTCWACNGSTKVAEDWDCLNSRTPVADAAK
jgi:RecJ-like exonuclease